MRGPVRGGSESGSFRTVPSPQDNLKVPASGSEAECWAECGPSVGWPPTMGNNRSMCASALERDVPTYRYTLGSTTRVWKPRAPGEQARAVISAWRRLTVAKMLHERLGDGAIWLEGDLLEIIIQTIPDAGMCISVGGPPGVSDCSTIAAALDAAQPGDTIKLLPGLYREPIVLQPSPSAVTVVGAGTRSSDVVVEWGDDSAESAGVRSVHNAGEVIEQLHATTLARVESELQSARATLAALRQGETFDAQQLRALWQGRAYSARVQWIKFCSPLRTHASGVVVKNLTLRSTGNSPAVFADAGGLLMENVVVEGGVVLETHTRLRGCKIEGAPHGVGVCVPTCHAPIVLENCVIKDCLLGVAITGPLQRLTVPTITRK